MDQRLSSQEKDKIYLKLFGIRKITEFYIYMKHNTVTYKIYVRYLKFL